MKNNSFAISDFLEKKRTTKQTKTAKTAKTTKQHKTIKQHKSFINKTKSVFLKSLKDLRKSRINKV